MSGRSLRFADFSSMDTVDFEALRGEINQVLGALPFVERIQATDPQSAANYAEAVAGITSYLNEISRLYDSIMPGLEPLLIKAREVGRETSRMRELIAC